MMVSKEIMPQEGQISMERARIVLAAAFFGISDAINHLTPSCEMHYYYCLHLNLLGDMYYYIT